MKAKVDVGTIPYGHCHCGCGQETNLAPQNNKRYGWVKEKPLRSLKGHSGNKSGNPSFRPGHQTARKVPKGEPPPSWRTQYRREYARRYHACNKESIKKSQTKCRLWALYRLTPEDLQRIEEFQAQHTVYRILLGSKRMGTDHCHKTGLIRGRLDWRVNRAYGLIENAFPDNTADVLRALAQYHDNPPATLALKERRYGVIGRATYKKKMVYGPLK